MAANIITPEDLEQFKADLLTEIQVILEKSPSKARKWLRSADIRNMLSISAGTLQALRTSGALPFSKINGTIFYAEKDVVQMLETHKTK